MLNVGDEAPDFVLPDGQRNSFRLSEFKGKYVVVYFYPKDDTPGCTIEAIDFTRLKDQFEKEGSVVFGISKDSCESHVAFAKKKNLTVILLSDEDSSAQKKYGVWRLKNFMGVESMGTARVTFLLDGEGKIVKIWDPVKPEGHAEEVLNEIKKMKE